MRGIVSLHSAVTGRTRAALGSATVCSYDNVMGMGGDVTQMVEHGTGTLPTQVRFPSAAKVFFFLPSQHSVQTLAVSVHPPCAIACVYVCAHVKDPVVHARVRWITETL